MSKEDNKEEAPEQEQSIWRSLGGTLLYLLVIVLLTWVIVTFVGQRTKVDGHSMEPTLSDGDNLIVDKLSYRFRDPDYCIPLPTCREYLLYQTYHWTAR